MKKKTERYTAAGGVVFRDELILVLDWSSRDEVRLPKGHVEPGETMREAALRETSEESGYLNLEIVADLGSQQVAFDDGGQHVVRIERYFLMTLEDEAGPPRGSGEVKFDPQWLTWEEALRTLTFEAEREWVRRARRVAFLKDTAGDEK